MHRSSRRHAHRGKATSPVSMTCRLPMFESKSMLAVVVLLPLTVGSSFDLPDDVFEPGETRPTRPKKKIIKKAEPTAQKRPIDALDVSACKDRATARLPSLWLALVTVVPVIPLTEMLLTQPASLSRSIPKVLRSVRCHQTRYRIPPRPLEQVSLCD